MILREAWIYCGFAAGAGGTDGSMAMFSPSEIGSSCCGSADTYVYVDPLAFHETNLSMS